MQGLKLERCINSTTCLPRAPVTVKVKRRISATVYLDNAACRSFIYKKFIVTPVDMESAAVAFICLQQRTPFIVVQSLSDLAASSSSLLNEANTYSTFAAQNAISTTIKFIQLLSG
uniref:Nucleoside phosphorylase domain-containing protein n=2 Tax=Nymphaea colorata TaxID=210225 RepID=A0A5K1E388_9MAGN